MFILKKSSNTSEKERKCLRKYAEGNNDTTNTCRLEREFFTLDTLSLVCQMQ